MYYRKTSDQEKKEFKVDDECQDAEEDQSD
jgi:hypothetical protein